MAKRGGCLRTILVLILLPMVWVAGWWFMSNLTRVINHESVEAVVVTLIASTDSDGDSTYAPVYEYRVDGETYRYESQVSYGGFLVPDVGDRKTLLYNPDNPTDARVRNMFFLLVLPAIVVAIPALILLTILVVSVRRAFRREDWATPAVGSQPPWTLPTEIEPGWRTIEATFMGTEPSQMDTEGRVRYRVKASAEMGDTMHRFVGEWVDEDPTLLLMERGNKVEVQLDPSDPTRYRVVTPAQD